MNDKWKANHTMRDPYFKISEEVIVLNHIDKSFLAEGVVESMVYDDDPETCLGFPGYYYRVAPISYELQCDLSEVLLRKKHTPGDDFETIIQKSKEIVIEEVVTLSTDDINFYKEYFCYGRNKNQAIINKMLKYLEIGNNK